MENTRKKRYRFRFTEFQGVFLVLVWVIAVVSCTGSLFSIKNPVTIVKQQWLRGVHKAMDYQLDYQYRVRPATPPKPNLFEFEGTLAPHRPLSTLTVKILFLDSDGKTLQTESIYFSGFRQGAGRAKIEKRFELPPEAVSFGFSHFSQERTFRP